MCIKKKICTELGTDPSTWSKYAPLPRPAWVEDQLPVLCDAIRAAAAGNLGTSLNLLRTMRSDDLRAWFVDHGKQAGFCRYPHLPHSASQVTTVIDERVRQPSKSQMELVFQRDGYRCRYCSLRIIPNYVFDLFGKIVGLDLFGTGGPAVQRHGGALTFRGCADHVVPHFLGGRTDMDNLVTACWPCNFGKDRFTVEEIGIEDPRRRSPLLSNDWDGLVSLVPQLQRVLAHGAAA
jgi:5-methylcytosine-specific restriction endonuclease McrA